MTKIKTHTVKKAQPLNGWFNKNIKLSYSDVYEIGNFEGGKLYGYLPYKYGHKEWKNAIEKGFTLGAKGSNGVKFINKKLLELKANCDARLYSKELHKNEAGDYLAIFNQESNHDSIKKLTNKLKGLIVFEDCHFSSDYVDNSEIEVSGSKAELPDTL